MPQVRAQVNTLALALAAETVGPVVREQGIKIGRAEDIAKIGITVKRLEAARAKPQPGPPGGAVAGRGHQVDRAAQGRGPVTQAVGPAIDLNIISRAGVQLRNNIGTVREVKRQAVLQKLDAPALGVALDPRTADIEPGLIIAAEEFLNGHAGFKTERVIQRGLTAALVRHPHQIGSARNPLQTVTGGLGALLCQGLAAGLHLDLFERQHTGVLRGRGVAGQQARQHQNSR